jgi:hypothetical protein
MVGAIAKDAAQNVASGESEFHALAFARGIRGLRDRDIAAASIVELLHDD